MTTMEEVVVEVQASFCLPVLHQGWQVVRLVGKMGVMVEMEAMVAMRMVAMGMVEMEVMVEMGVEATIKPLRQRLFPLLAPVCRLTSFLFLVPVFHQALLPLSVDLFRQQLFQPCPPMPQKGDVLGHRPWKQQPLI